MEPHPQDPPHPQGRLSALRVEPGSFRDPDSRVFTTDDAVYRALSAQGLRDWEALAASELYRRYTADGSIVATEVVEGADAPEGLHEDAAALLRHELVPVVSYPYEWCFGMLQDAALLQLELLRSALDENLILKDSSPYNVQWRGARPVFIDVGSFERLREGEPWIGYRQFCMLYLFPLLLQAYKDVPFQPWLRGRIDGIAPQELRNLMSLRDVFRRGVLMHVVLHARLERRRPETSGEIKQELRKAGFKKELIAANVKGLERLIRSLRWQPSATVFSDYAATHSYSDAALDEKTEFVRAAAATRRWELVWDLGCNDARFSRIAAEHADYVLAVDADASLVDAVYRRLKEERADSILPLVMNVSDPSPGLGWRGLERRPLAARGTPDLTLCLALIHHVVISGNVPVREFIAWLASLETSLVIEFPTPEDPMVRRMLSAKREATHPDYERGFFEAALAEWFDIDRTEELSSGTRVLYFAHPRS